VAKAAETAQKTAMENKSDSVTISKEALSKAVQVQSHSREAQESNTGKGKK
jgi:hypothetical protein